MATQYELRSFTKPLLRGHTPIALEPADVTETLPTHVGDYFDGSPVMEPCAQTRAGEVQPLDAAQVMAEAARLFSTSDCWQLTINEYVKDASGAVLRSPPHWCASVEQVQAYLDEAQA